MATKKAVKRTTKTGKARVTLVHSPAYIKRASNVTKAPPTKRLKARRAVNTAKGRFPNPTIYAPYWIYQIHADRKVFVCACHTKEVAAELRALLQRRASHGVVFTAEKAY